MNCCAFQWEWTVVPFSGMCLSAGMNCCAFQWDELLCLSAGMNCCAFQWEWTVVPFSGKLKETSLENGSMLVRLLMEAINYTCIVCSAAWNDSTTVILYVATRVYKPPKSMQHCKRAKLKHGLKIETWCHLMWCVWLQLSVCTHLPYLHVFVNIPAPPTPFP